MWIPMNVFFKKHLEGKLITGCTLFFYKCHSTFILATAAIYVNHIWIVAKQSIYKHLGYFSIHTLSSCHSEFELGAAVAVRSKHKCILQLPPPTKNARQNLPIFYPHLLPSSSQLVFLVAKENQRIPEVQLPHHWWTWAVSEAPMNKIHLKMLLHPSRTSSACPPIHLQHRFSLQYPLNRTHPELLHFND